MKTINKTMIIYSVAAIILAVPFVAMQFTNEVKWNLSDFIIAGILLFATAFLIDIILHKVSTDSRKFIYISIALAVLFLIWAELAVGVFGTPFAGN
ncbi:hypothetical protein [Chryseobacterium lacus]|uniref:hypothetical protein n=1 Tax=Chryseobacterium lacus TaxID=2058346 RepID=UPI000F88526A|nr:hypothetical protein [Chryseobacterium lacus]RST25717.1 hypothetical protein EIZ46_09970 [Chryseobacterium lacus]